MTSLAFMQDLHRSMSAATLLLQKSKNKSNSNTTRKSVTSPSEIIADADVIDLQLRGLVERPKANQTSLDPLLPIDQNTIKKKQDTESIKISVDKTSDEDQLLQKFHLENLRITHMETISSRIQLMNSSLMHKQQNLVREQQDSIQQSAMNQMERMTALVSNQTRKQFDYFKELENAFKENQEPLSRITVNSNRTNISSQSMYSNNIQSMSNIEFQPIIHDIKGLKDDIKSVKESVDVIASIVQTNQIISERRSEMNSSPLDSLFDSKTRPNITNQPRKFIATFNYAKLRQNLKTLDFENESLRESGLFKEVHVLGDLLEKIRIDEAVNEALKTEEPVAKKKEPKNPLVLKSRPISPKKNAPKTKIVKKLAQSDPSQTRPTQAKPSLSKRAPPKLHLKKAESEKRISQIRSLSPSRSVHSPNRTPNFYNVKLSNAPVFLRRTSIRPPSLAFLEGSRNRSSRFFTTKCSRKSRNLSPSIKSRIFEETQNVEHKRSDYNAPPLTPPMLMIHQKFVKASGTQTIPESTNKSTQRSPEASIDIPPTVILKQSPVFTKQIEKTSHSSIQTDVIIEHTDRAIQYSPKQAPHQWIKEISFKPDSSKVQPDVGSNLASMRRVEKRIAEWIQNEVMLRLLAREPSPVTENIPAENVMKESKPEPDIADKESLSIISEVRHESLLDKYSTSGDVHVEALIEHEPATANETSQSVPTFEEEVTIEAAQTPLEVSPDPTIDKDNSLETESLIDNNFEIDQINNQIEPVIPDTSSHASHVTISHSSEQSAELEPNTQHTIEQVDESLKENIIAPVKLLQFDFSVQTDAEIIPQNNISNQVDTAIQVIKPDITESSSIAIEKSIEVQCSITESSINISSQFDTSSQTPEKSSSHSATGISAVIKTLTTVFTHH